MGRHRWFIATLLALALVFQAAAARVVYAQNSAYGQSLSLHCDREASGDHSAPASNGGRKHDCLSCQQCASGSTGGLAIVAPATLTTFVAGPRFRASTKSLAAFDLSGRAQLPRAPPSLS